MESNNSETEKSKELSGRKRKKLYNKLREQMEFYFSDSNLAKDKFLYKLIQQNSDGYVDLEVFKSFNKIKALSEDINFIASSLSKSQILEVSEDRTKVRRKTPIEISKDFDACTLYVEGLPAHADHKWIKDVFDHFGTVEYINIPRFNISHKIKGFAFIEFSSPESVVKACQFYKNSSEKETNAEEEIIDTKEEKTRKAEDTGIKKAKRIKTNSNSEVPSEMVCEISETDVDESLKCDNSNLNEEQHQKIKKKRKHENSDADDEEPCKKPKVSAERALNNDRVVHQTELPDSQNNPNSSKPETMDEELSKLPENNCSIEDTKDESPAKVKRKRKHSKKNRNRHERPTLRVMSKSEWKAYRNKYLDLQRTTMSYLKKQILLESQEMREQETNTKLEHIPKKELKFQQGVIIKIKLLKPIENPTEIKEQIKACTVSAYIDAPLGSDEVFIRCHTAEDAGSILKDKKLIHIGNTLLLTGSKEHEYWEKIKSDRETKFSTPTTRKRRGRDKLIAKAAKLVEQKNKHIYFDE